MIATRGKNTLTLDKIRKGQQVIIVSIPKGEVRTQAIRFGVGEGAVVSLAEALPAGPVVIQKNRQEIAIGRRLAKQIEVRLLPEVVKGR